MLVCDHGDHAARIGTGVVAPGDCLLVGVPMSGVAAIVVSITAVASPMWGWRPEKRLHRIPGNLRCQGEVGVRSEPYPRSRRSRSSWTALTRPHERNDAVRV